MARIESRGKYTIYGGGKNKYGGLYDGRYQMGGSAKKGGARHFGISDPGHGGRPSRPDHPERVAFRNNPGLQEKLFAGFTVGNHKALMTVKEYRKRSKLDKLAILGYAHNQGAVGPLNPDSSVRSAKVWLQTGEGGSDAFKTGGTKYYKALNKAFRKHNVVSQPVAQVQPVAPAVDPTVTQAGLSTAGLTEVAKANNLKYFGNETGNSGKGYKSSRTFGKAYNFSLNNTVGSIPFTGDRRISSQWKADNLIVVGLPTPYILGGGPPKINKHLSTSLIRAVTESRAKYGLPLTHVGGFASKGKSGRFSSHAWGAAVDFDSVVNPFSRDGLMTRSRISSAIKNDKGYYQQFWYFKNPSTGQTYLDHLKESFANNTKALPLYIFVAGPAENNGIANIFEKNGW